MNLVESVDIIMKYIKGTSCGVAVGRGGAEPP